MKRRYKTFYQIAWLHLNFCPYYFDSLCKMCTYGLARRKLDPWSCWFALQMLSTLARLPAQSNINGACLHLCSCMLGNMPPYSFFILRRILVWKSLFSFHNELQSSSGNKSGFFFICISNLFLLVVLILIWFRHHIFQAKCQCK